MRVGEKKRVNERESEREKERERERGKSERENDVYELFQNMIWYC